jgi:hypothetical protein
VLIEIDKLKESEKQWFIKFLDDLDPELRKIELAKKKAGIGMWAKGGTSLTYKYNPEEWSNLAEAAKERGTYDDAVNDDIDKALDELTEEQREAAEIDGGYGLGFGREEGNEDEFD